MKYSEIEDFYLIILVVFVIFIQIIWWPLSSNLFFLILLFVNLDELRDAPFNRLDFSNYFEVLGL